MKYLKCILMYYWVFSISMPLNLVYKSLSVSILILLPRSTTKYWIAELLVPPKINHPPIYMQISLLVDIHLCTCTSHEYYWQSFNNPSDFCQSYKPLTHMRQDGIVIHTKLVKLIIIQYLSIWISLLLNTWVISYHISSIIWKWRLNLENKANKKELIY